MTLSLPVLIVASGFWLILLVGCGIFFMLASNFKKSYVRESLVVADLKSKVAELAAQISEGNATTSEAVQQPQQETDPQHKAEDMELLKRRIALLESELAAAESKVDGQGKEDGSLVSKLRLDKLNEKYMNIQALWESTNQELIRADGKIAELLGAKAALEKERAMLERQVASLSETDVDTDVASLREVIINFTEDSRELLLEIEKLNTEKVALEQQIKDMEEGGKGTAGKVVGLQRKLDEAEAEIDALKAAHR